MNVIEALLGIRKIKLAPHQTEITRGFPPIGWHDRHRSLTVTTRGLILVLPAAR